MDEVEVLVEVANGVATTNTDLQQALRQKIKNTIGISMKISLKETDSIPKSQGGKLKRVLDQRSL